MRWISNVIQGKNAVTKTPAADPNVRQWAVRKLEIAKRKAERASAFSSQKQGEFSGGLEEPEESALPDLVLPMEMRQQFENKLRGRSDLEEAV